MTIAQRWRDNPDAAKQKVRLIFPRIDTQDTESQGSALRGNMAVVEDGTDSLAYPLCKSTTLGVHIWLETVDYITKHATS